MSNNEQMIRINKVSELTGVNAITLRAWENRYQLITPFRTDSGHRLYTPDDVERIHNIVRWINKGIPVSRIKPLLEKEQQADMPDKTIKKKDMWSEHKEKMLAAIKSFNLLELEKIYNTLLSLYPINLITEHIITKLFKTLGNEWQKSELGIAEEHFFSVYIRNKIGARLHHQNLIKHDKTLILSCLPQELHELGLLLFSLFLTENGYHCIVLGANMPFAELPPITKKVKVDGIVLYGKVNNELRVGIKGLAQMVPCKIFIASEDHSDTQLADDKTIVPISRHFELALRQIESTLKIKGKSKS